MSREDVAVEECVDKRAEMPQYLTEASASSIFSNGISSSLRWVRTHAEPPCVVQNSADFFFSFPIIYCMPTCKTHAGRRKVRESGFGGYGRVVLADPRSFYVYVVRGNKEVLRNFQALHIHTRATQTQYRSILDSSTSTTTGHSPLVQSSCLPPRPLTLHAFHIFPRTRLLVSDVTVKDEPEPRVETISMKLQCASRRSKSRWFARSRSRRGRPAI